MTGDYRFLVCDFRSGSGQQLVTGNLLPVTRHSSLVTDKLSLFTARGDEQWGCIIIITHAITSRASSG
jgi:hypothetical protein